MRTILIGMVGIVDQVETRFQVPLYKEKSVPHAGGDEPQASPDDVAVRQCSPRRRG